MANANVGRKKLLTTIVTLTIIIILSFFGINISDVISNQNGQTEQTQSETQIQDVNLDGVLDLSMIDVGQADSFVFRQKGKTALIDCGTRSTGKDVVDYLKNLGIKKLDYVVGTHPHDDHMGGMYDVITNFEIGEIIIPEITKNQITSNWYMKLIKEIKTGDYKVTYPSVGDEFLLGDAKMTVLAPFEEPNENLNDYSIVFMITYGTMDVLMTGDMEVDVENQILESHKDIEAEILKVGHHGSDSSSCDAFLDAVKPKYALISSKIGNKYNHPIKSVMEKLQKRAVKVYRTDETGTVCAKITANNIEFVGAQGDYLSGEELELKVVK